MDKIKIRDCKDLMDKIFSVREKINENDSIVVVAKYAQAKEIISACIKADFDIYTLLLYDPDADIYNKEYYITIDRTGFWCEPAYVDGRYIVSEGAVGFIYDDCCSAIISKVNTDITVEVCKALPKKVMPKPYKESEYNKDNNLEEEANNNCDCKFEEDDDELTEEEAIRYLRLIKESINDLKRLRYLYL